MTLAVTRDLLQLFIELDKMDGSVSKKAISAPRNQLESTREQEVEVIDVDAPSTNFDDVTQTPMFHHSYGELLMRLLLHL